MNDDSMVIIFKDGVIFGVDFCIMIGVYIVNCVIDKFIRVYDIIWCCWFGFVVDI